MAAKNLSLKAEKLGALPRVLVVGGAGFVGSHLCTELLEKDCFTVCLDKLTQAKKYNLEPIIKKKNFEVINWSAKKIFKKLSAWEFDYIFLAASEPEALSLVPEFLDLCQKQHAKLLFVSSVFLTKELKAIENLVSRYFSRLDLDCRIVRLAQVFGPRMPLSDKDELGQLFVNLKTKTIFKVQGEGNKVLYPLFITDAVEGILKAMFSQNSQGKIYTLSPAKAIKILEFVNILKKATGRTLGAEFVATRTKAQILLKTKEAVETQKQLHWRPRTTLEEAVKKTTLWFTQTDLFPVKPEPTIKAKLTRIFLIFLLTLFIFILCPLGILLYLYSQSVGQLKNLGQALKTYDLSALEKKLPQAQKNFSQGEKLLVRFSGVTSFLHWGKPTSQLYRIFDYGLSLGKLADLTLKISSQVEQMSQFVFGGRSGDFYSDCEKMVFYLDQLSETLSFMQAGGTETQFSAVQQYLPFDREGITLSRQLVKILPELLALEDKKTYLVLLQNNLELRPSGGFISSLGLITLEKGRLLDFQVESAESSDSELGGQIEPPAPLTKYLGEKSWYLRDSNWDPHFPSSAAQAEWFLEKASHRQAAGTLAIDLYGFKEILKVLGQVTLKDSPEVISADNLFERAQFFSTTGNSGQKDFLSQLALAVFEKIKQLNKKDWLTLMPALYNALEKKALLVSLGDAKPASFFNEHGWDGALRQQTTQEDVLTDYLSLVEANLSGNKNNYYLKRDIFQEINILESFNLQEKTTIVYQNKNTLSTPVSMSYKSYLRVYLPLAAEIKSVKVGRDVLNLSLFGNDKLDFFEEHGKKGVGFFIEVPNGKNLIVEINTQPQAGLVFKDGKAVYALYFQKQPGAGENSFNLQFTLAKGLKVSQTIPEAKNSPPQVQFTTDTDKDRAFLIEFEKE